jgi:hypothetical protein
MQWYELSDIITFWYEGMWNEDIRDAVNLRYGTNYSLEEVEQVIQENT